MSDCSDVDESDDGVDSSGAHSSGVDLNGAQPIIGRRSWWTVMLDGHDSWGSFRVTHGAYGFRSYHLEVFPPGTALGDRRLLRAALNFPSWGAATWLLITLSAAPQVGATSAMLGATVVYLIVGAVVHAATAHTRPRVRTLSVVRGPRELEIDGEATEERLRGLVTVLWAADAGGRRGRISLVEHEALCWQVYDELPRHRSPGIRNPPGKS